MITDAILGEQLAHDFLPRCAQACNRLVKLRSPAGVLLQASVDGRSAAHFRGQILATGILPPTAALSKKTGPVSGARDRVTLCATRRRLRVGAMDCNLTSMSDNLLQPSTLTYILP